MRDLIYLIFILVLVFNGCSIEFEINGSEYSYSVQPLVITNFEVEDEIDN